MKKLIILLVFLSFVFSGFAVNVTVELTPEQVVAIKDHFGTTNNQEALAFFRNWVSNEADGWYVTYLKKDIDDIAAALLADPEKIAAIKAALGL